MYKVVNFDISGFCNAKCTWCVTGIQVRSKDAVKNNGKFIDPETFANALDYMLDLKLISTDSLINLFNWGEPLIHPRFSEIIEVLNKRELFFGISTNASKVPDIEPLSMRRLSRFEISMPGFSQLSYDRIHQFKFNKILSNIDSLLFLLKQGGYKGTANLVFHIYQFNINEIKSANEFCSDRNLDFLPYAAYLNDFEKALGYLNSTLDASELKKISKDLLMYYVDDLIASRPQDYRCPQFNYLTLDESCQVLTCCVVPKGHPNYSIGNLFSLSAEEIATNKLNQPVCISCGDSGLDYWGHVGHIPAFVEKGSRDKMISIATKILPKPLLRNIRANYFKLLNHF